MKQSELIQLITDPQQARSEDVARLQDLKKQFPFFQSAHLLLTLVSKRHDSSLFQQSLKSTAITVPSRSRLYHLLSTAAEEMEKPVVADLKPLQAEVIQPLVSEIEKSREEPAPEVSVTSEIRHLKAIELASEKEQQPDEEALNRQVEKEVEKQIVNAFVEKELLHTPDLHKAAEKKDSGSFTDWLKVLKNEVAVENNESKEKPKRTFRPVNDKKSEQQSIIDKVIEMNPGNIRLNPNQKFFAADNKAKESLLESEDLVTETLAKIYALQGNISKAVRAYEILSLKFPQKSAYFATLIENLKKGT